jgi:hypothetical protein
MADHDPLGVNQAQEDVARRAAKQKQRQKEVEEAAKKLSQAEQGAAQANKQPTDAQKKKGVNANANANASASATRGKGASDGPLGLLRGLSSRRAGSGAGGSVVDKNRLVPEAIGLASLPRWQADFSTASEDTTGANATSSSTSSSSSSSAGRGEAEGEVRFQLMQELNRKVVLSTCDPLALVVDALVHSSNEPLSDRKDLNARLFTAAGRSFSVGIRMGWCEC